MRQITIGDVTETVVERADYPPEKLNAILSNEVRRYIEKPDYDHLEARQQLKEPSRLIELGKRQSSRFFLLGRSIEQRTWRWRPLGPDELNLPRPL